MRYYPLNYQQINQAEGFINPSQIKAYKNKSFAYWERALFQRACSVIDLENLPPNWEGSTRDFLYYCLFRFGYVAVFDSDEFGLSFMNCTLEDYNFYYQPVNAKVTNPKLRRDFKIGEDCEILKLTPDYMGVWDIITYSAEKLSNMDNAVNMSITNSKLGWMLFAKNKGIAEALKKAFDKINMGEPMVILDKMILDEDSNGTPTTPWQYFERKDIKSSYLLTEQLNDMQTILNNFDTEIGIPTTANIGKKERMVTAEAESKIIDSVSRSTVWLHTINSSLDVINEHFGTNIKAVLHYDNMKENDINGTFKNDNLGV